MTSLLLSQDTLWALNDFFKNLTMDGYSADIRHYLNVRSLMSYAMNQFLCNCAWSYLEETIREFVWYPLRMKCLKPNQITLKYIINDQFCMLRYGLFYLKLSWMLMNYNNLLSWNGQTYGQPQFQHLNLEISNSHVYFKTNGLN